MTTEEPPRPYNPMAKFIRQGRDFNPPVADMMLERKHFAGWNSRFRIEMKIIPKNKYSSAKGVIKIFKIINDGTQRHLYTTQSYDFRYIQTPSENTFHFIFHTLPYGESYTYVIQYHVVFDNNTESLYSFNDNIQNTTASPLLMDQLKIVSSSKKPISIGYLDVLNTTGDANILNSNLKFTVDGISSNENLIQDVATLTASEQLDWMFYPVYIKSVGIGGFPHLKLQNWVKEMYSDMVLLIIHRDKLVFVAPLEDLDEQNFKIRYHFSDIIDESDEGPVLDPSTREYGLNTGIDFLFLNSGWRIASPERLWFFIILVCSLLLYITYIYFALDILFIIIPVPLVVFYTTRLRSLGLEDVDPNIYAEMKRQWVIILVVAVGIGLLYYLYNRARVI